MAKSPSAAFETTYKDCFKQSEHDKIRYMSNAAARLRALLDRPGILLMPGCHDAISARLIEEAGFEIGRGLLRAAGNQRTDDDAPCLLNVGWRLYVMA